MIPERDRIKTVMTTAEIAAEMERGDYSAEMLLHHLVRRFNEAQRELEQERQDRVQAEKDVCRALGERNDARAELEQIKAILADPLAVHLNMMRGTIKCTPANLRHLLGDSTNEED